MMRIGYAYGLLATLTLQATAGRTRVTVGAYAVEPPAADATPPFLLRGNDLIVSAPRPMALCCD